MRGVTVLLEPGAKAREPQGAGRRSVARNQVRLGAAGVGTFCAGARREGQRVPDNRRVSSGVSEPFGATVVLVERGRRDSEPALRRAEDAGVEQGYAPGEDAECRNRVRRLGETTVSGQGVHVGGEDDGV